MRVLGGMLYCFSWLFLGYTPEPAVAHHAAITC